MTYAALGPAEIRRHITGYVIVSPFIAVHPASAPWRLTVIVGRIAARIMPNFQLVQRLDPIWIARDPEVGRAFQADPLCHDTGTLEGMGGMLDRGADLASGRVDIVDNDDPEQVMRLWIAHGSADRVTSFDATKEWVDRSKVKDLTFKVYEGWYHKCEFSIS